ncbi:EF-P beta-lysylation protein EpmB [Litorivicinus lipolyticus]|uniref:EF-P beta-lysylation protein EpmB n=1 Tax=Litorivicinus lipolyticus TaxID=418701 RepID=UPI003B5C9650
MSTWQSQLSDGFRSASELLAFLQLPAAGMSAAAQADFATRVPRHFAALMTPGDLDDPLLRQVLPIGDETLQVPGFSDDPLAEQQNAAPGVLHKYGSRALLILRGGCAVNCRYCFRRAFPYAELSWSARTQRDALGYLRADAGINEVILSGGDPLMASDEAIADLVGELAGIDHITRVRVHSRLPVVMPDRLTPQLHQALTGTRLKPVLMLHANHPREISRALHERLQPFVRDLPVFNQAVLLRGVNDDASTLAALSEALFNSRIQPYYLFLLDRVRGAAHFEVPEAEAKVVYRDLQSRLPGFLVPRLAREIPDKPNKTLVL